MADKKVMAELSYIDNTGDTTVVYPHTKPDVVFYSDGETLEDKTNFFDCGSFDERIVNDFRKMTVGEFEKMKVSEVE